MSVVFAFFVLAMIGLFTCGEEEMAGFSWPVLPLYLALSGLFVVIGLTASVIWCVLVKMRIISVDTDPRR